MRLLTLIALIISTLSGRLSAQRIEQSRVGVPRLRTEVATPAYEPVPLKDPASTNASTGALVAGGVRGGLLGILVGIGVGGVLRSAETRRQCEAPGSHEAFECADILGYAAFGEVIGIPVGVYAANKGRGRLPLMILGSMGVVLLGVAASVAAPPVLLLIPAAQIGISMTIASSG